MAIHRVKGVPGKGIEAARKRIEQAFSRGLVKAGLFVQRESQKIVPVDTGNLKNSAFTRKFGSGRLTVVVIGYTAAYAIFVHEDDQARHKEGKEYKFLEKAVRRNVRKINEIVALEMRAAL